MVAIEPERQYRPATQARLERQIRLRHLRVLLAIDDRGGVTRAAEHLGVTQAAISKTVADIEAMVDAPILDRQGRNFVLNPAGLSILSSARHIAAEVHVLAENLDLLREGAIGQVSIGVQSISTQFVMARAVAELKREWPRATVHMEEGLLPDVLRDLRAGRYDLAVGRIDPKLLNPDLEGFTMVFDPMVVMASPNHAVLGRLPLTWADAAREAWCLPLPGVPARDHFDNTLRVMGIDPPTNIVQCSSFAQVLAMQQVMPCLTLAAQGLAEQWAGVGTVAITNLAIPSLTSPIGLIWSKALALGPTARRFRQIVMARGDSVPDRCADPYAFDPMLGFPGLAPSAEQ